jgi:hypothetical protein
VTSVQTPSPAAIISLEGLDIAPTPAQAAASNHAREECTLKGVFSCGMCKKELGTNPDDLLVCGGCENAFYCSRKCQKINWKSHKVSITNLFNLLR